MKAVVKWTVRINYVTSTFCHVDICYPIIGNGLVIEELDISHRKGTEDKAVHTACSAPIAGYFF